ncbi:hypothetical protein DIPPA_05817 [Diplonema papillatum]|nr:hypothetical protein DIPPA_05817 [Diplonema papillatum]
MEFVCVVGDACYAIAVGVDETVGKLKKRMRFEHGLEEEHYELVCDGERLPENEPFGRLPVCSGGHLVARATRRGAALAFLRAARTPVTKDAFHSAVLARDEELCRNLLAAGVLPLAVPKIAKDPPGFMLPGYLASSYRAGSFSAYRLIADHVASNASPRSNEPTVDVLVRLAVCVEPGELKDLLTRHTVLPGTAEVVLEREANKFQDKWRRHLPVVRCLLDQGACPLARMNSSTPLALACRYFPEAAAAMLPRVSAADGPETSFDDSRTTFLHLACRQPSNARLPLVARLCEKFGAAAVNSTDAKGVTPLWRACNSRSPCCLALVTALLEHGADPLLGAAQYGRPVLRAHVRSHWAAVVLLQQKGGGDVAQALAAASLPRPKVKRGKQ